MIITGVTGLSQVCLSKSLHGQCPVPPGYVLAKTTLETHAHVYNCIHTLFLNRAKYPSHQHNLDRLAVAELSQNQPFLGASLFLNRSPKGNLFDLHLPMGVGGLRNSEWFRGK